MWLRSPANLARIALLLFIGGCGICLAGLDYGRKISTNVLDLIPANERSPEIRIIRDFSKSAQTRVMLFALADSAHPDRPPVIAAEAFAERLRQSPEFSEVIVLNGTGTQDELGAAIFEQRFELLLPGWLGDKARAFAATGLPPAAFSEWLAETAVADLDTFLDRPEALALQDVLVRDPLLLVPELIDHAQLATPPSDQGHALVWSLITPSPLAEAGQQPVFNVIDDAIRTGEITHPTVTVQWSGINRLAAASRARIENEITLLHMFSVAAVLLVCAIFVRRLSGLVHFVPVIGLAMLGAWTASTLVFDRLHILVFVLGSLLAGVAIDYGVYIYLQPASRPGEPYREKLRRLLKPLLASCLTTVAGFSLLLFSDLPLIRQIGLFVSTGLLSALVGAMLYFAQLKNPFLPSRTWGRGGEVAHHPGIRWTVRGLAVVALALALIGPWRLQWRDDVRDLDIPSVELKTNEADLRAMFGNDTEQTRAYLSYGEDVATARNHLQGFLDHVAKQHPTVETSSLGLLLPTRNDWQALPERLQSLGDFPAAFRAKLQAHNFEPEAFQEFFEAWADFLKRPLPPTYADVTTRMNAVLVGPLALLQSSRGPYWFLTLAETQTDLSLPEANQTVSVDQLQSLNQLFARYRWSALQLSLVGLGFIIAGIFLVYAPRRGLRIAVIPAGACLIVFGVFGFSGQALNLFNLLGAFLGFCLSHNYAIFSSDHAHAGGTTPVAIRLSALSTSAAFGVLGFSQIPAIHALGITVSLIVVTALLMVELEPMLRRHAP